MNEIRDSPKSIWCQPSDFTATVVYACFTVLRAGDGIHDYQSMLTCGEDKQRKGKRVKPPVV
jgi:hypothetical protein